MKLALALVALTGCSGSSAPSCPGAAAARSLVEGFCKSGEADRCFYDQSPLDGF